MDINFTKKYLDNLLAAVKKIMLERSLGTDFNFYSMYLENEDYKKKMEKDYKKKKFKFIIITADKFSQSTKNGNTQKTQTYKIRVCNENKDQDAGFEETMNIASNIIDSFTKNPLATQKKDGYSYHINLDNITGQLNEELTVGDYWVYEIFVTLDLPL